MQKREDRVKEVGLEEGEGVFRKERKTRHEQTQKHLVVFLSTVVDGKSGRERTLTEGVGACVYRRAMLRPGLITVLWNKKNILCTSILMHLEQLI